MSPGKGIGVSPIFGDKVINWAAYWDSIYFNLVTEGHSFMERFYPQFHSDLNVTTFYNASLSGSTVANCVSRAATVDSKLITETSTYKNILVLWIGANDINNTPGIGTVVYNALKIYVQARLAAGWKVYLFTVTPSNGYLKGDTSIVMNQEKIIFNNLLRNDLSLISGVYLLDTDTHSQFDDSNDLDYYEDTIHPSGMGCILASSMLVYKIRKVYDLKPESIVLGSELVDQTLWKDAAHVWWDEYFQAGWSADGIKLSCDGTTGVVATNHVFSGNKKYKTQISVTVNSGYMFCPGQVIKIYKTANPIFNTLRNATPAPLYINSILFNGSINSLSIKEIIKPVFVSGLVTEVAPTSVILTFNTALDESLISDVSAFTLAGKTITGITILGAVVTLTVSVPYQYGSVITVDYTRPVLNPLKALIGDDHVASFTGKSIVNTISIIPIITDGHTVGWYDAQDLTNITKDISGNVSLWKDKLGSGHDLTNVSILGPTDCPIWSLDGILGNGVWNAMATSAFTLNQPIFIYAVLKRVTWQSSRYFFDGVANTVSIMDSTATPKISAYAGNFSAESSDVPLDTFVVLKVLFYGSSSKLIIDAHTPITGNFGAHNMGGLILFANSGGYGSNIQVKELIVRNVSDGAGDELSIYNYLKDKYGL